MRWRLFAALLSVLVVVGWVGRARAGSGDDKVHVVYWEKWTGFEKDAIREVVDDFNQSQDRIFVDLVSVSVIRQKTLLATAGGNPPDLAGLMNDAVVEFAEKNALTPLDDF